MSTQTTGQNGRPPNVAPIAKSPAVWIIILGAFFGFITLVGLFAFAYLASSNSHLCTSFAFQLLAAGFALGAALAGSFIGGGAGARGTGNQAGFNLTYGLTGGAAFLIITLVTFSIFAPKGCDLIGNEQLQSDLQKAKSELESTKVSLDNVKTALASVTAQRDESVSANAAARAEIRRLASAVRNLLPDAPQLAANLSSVTNLVTQSCSGGPHGTDPLHANEIRSISAEAATRIVSAQTAIASILQSVPADLKN